MPATSLSASNQHKSDRVQLQQWQQQQAKWLASDADECNIFTRNASNKKQKRIFLYTHTYLYMYVCIYLCVYEKVRKSFFTCLDWLRLRLRCFHQPVEWLTDHLFCYCWFVDSKQLVINRKWSINVAFFLLPVVVVLLL